MELSQRVQALQESATLAVSGRAKQLKADGVDVVSFGAGEPDFDTPAHIRQACKDALDAGHTRYATPVAGVNPLREAICGKFKRDNDLDYTPDQVVVTVGGKHGLYLAFEALLNPGDEVIIPVPYWVSYPEQVKLCGGKVVEVRPDESRDFKLTADELSAALTDRTKILVLNSPSNPGGFTYSAAEQRALAEVLADRDIVVFSDEMYDRLIYTDEPFVSFANVHEAMYDKTVTFNAISKTYAATGWRCGYAAGPQPIIKGITKLQSQETSGTATFIQHAAAAALNGDQGCVAEMRAEFKRRAEHMHARLNALPGVRCLQPTGAFYAFPNVAGTYARLGVSGSVEFATKMLEEAHVALVPGIAFGSDENVRLSFATSTEQIDKGLDRLADALK
jgi:aspartate aminotransferase